MRSSILLLAGALLLAAPEGAWAEANPCPGQPVPAWQGESRFERVTVTGGHQGTVLRPKERGRHPGVVIMHGRGGSQCGLWWAGRFLAGHGYVALVLTHDGDLAGHRRAVLDGIAFLRSRANPYRRGDEAEPARSGGPFAGLERSDARAGRRAAHRRDRGAGLAEADRARGPRRRRGLREAASPACRALGLAMDFPCLERPDRLDPDLKLSGFESWREAGLPTLTAVLAGFEHSSFTARGSEAQQRLVGRYVRRWLARYLKRRPARKALRSLLRRTAPLSGGFRSAAFIPGLIDCADLRRC